MTNKELMTRLTMLEREVALLRCRVEKKLKEEGPPPLAPFLFPQGGKIRTSRRP